MKSPATGTSPTSGSRPKRICVPGMRKRESSRSASHSSRAISSATVLAGIVAMGRVRAGMLGFSADRARHAKAMRRFRGANETIPSPPRSGGEGVRGSACGGVVVVPVAVAVDVIGRVVAVAAMAAVRRDLVARDAADHGAADHADRAAMRHGAAEQAAAAGAEHGSGGLAAFAAGIGGRRGGADRDHRERHYLPDLHIHLLLESSTGDNAPAKWQVPLSTDFSSQRRYNASFHALARL